MLKPFIGTKVYTDLTGKGKRTLRPSLWLHCNVQISDVVEILADFLELNGPPKTLPRRDAQTISETIEKTQSRE